MDRWQREIFEKNNVNLDALFRDHIERLEDPARDITRLWDVSNASPHIIGEEYDALDYGRKFQSHLKHRNLELMRKAVPDKLAAVVAAARNEGPYLLEWIAHYKAVGFDHIFIYSNDNTDHSTGLLWLLSQAGIITFIENCVKVGTRPQIKALEHSIHFLDELRRYEHVAYFDLDEFLIPDEKYDFSVSGLLSALNEKWAGREPGALFVHWDWYGSDGQRTYREGLIQERFKLRKDYGTIKSIVRLQQVSHIDDVHIPDHHLIYVNSALEQTSTINYASQPIEYSGARLNHYFHKSFEEYSIKKNRGSADPSAREFNDFFQWEPIENVNGTRLGTPSVVIDRVKTIMHDLRQIPGVLELEKLSIIKQRRLASQCFQHGIDEAYKTMRTLAVESGRRNT